MICIEVIGSNPEILKKLYLFILWLISKKKTHGYGLIKVLQGCGFRSSKASRLYPLLNTMLKEGLISQEEEAHGKRIRKIYALTATGRKKLEAGKKRFFSGLIREFLREMIS